MLLSKASVRDFSMIATAISKTYYNCKETCRPSTRQSGPSTKNKIYQSTNQQLIEIRKECKAKFDDVK